MMELLEGIDVKGYPADYLVARMRGRRRGMMKDWESGLEKIGSGKRGDYPEEPGLQAEIWGDMLNELRWVYRQMDGRLRKVFGPFFLYCEMKTVRFYLRFRKAGIDEVLQRILEGSLLSDKIKKVLKGPQDLALIIRELEKLFSGFSDHFNRMEKIFLEKGIGGLEQKLMDGCLSSLICLPLKPEIERLFRRLIGIRNLIALYKFMKWELRMPEFLQGGEIDPQALFRAAVLRDPVLFSSLAEMETGNAGPAAIESVLLSRISRSLHSGETDPLGTGFILDYLWNSLMQARNRSILANGRGLDTALLREELIR